MKLLLLFVVFAAILLMSYFAWPDDGPQKPGSNLKPPSNPNASSTLPAKRKPMKRKSGRIRLSSAWHLRRNRARDKAPLVCFPNPLSLGSRFSNLYERYCRIGRGKYFAALLKVIA